ncbi:DMT family transporter [Corynebacterium sp. CNCTC7651]|nr:DMT family transporter [Corynebacterium sp. CNCTC7651]
MIGAIIPIQTAANSSLARGNPLPSFDSQVGNPWWIWLGGCFGVLFVIGNILLFPKLGAVQTVVLPILGQVTMGLAIDQFGLFGAKQVDVGVLRLLGAGVVLVGIAVVLGVGRAGVGGAGSGGSGGSVLGGAADGAGVWAYRALGVGIGMGSAMQTAINGYLGTIAGSAFHAAEINLTVGAVLLLAAVLVTSPRQLVRRPEPGPWWMWLGGVIGAVFVAGGATLAPILGTATTVIAFNAGTIAGGQVMESVGAFGARKRPLDTRRLVGLALTLAGVVAVRLL